MAKRYRSKSAHAAQASRRAESDALSYKWRGANYIGHDQSVLEAKSLAIGQAGAGRVARVAGMSQSLLDADLGHKRQ